jgi:hypothetical protein
MLTKGAGPPGLWLLTIPGRKTGLCRTTRRPREEHESRWLAAPFGPGGWAQNTRAARRGDACLVPQPARHRLRGARTATAGPPQPPVLSPSGGGCPPGARS